jgi:ribonuclease HI
MKISNYGKKNLIMKEVKIYTDGGAIKNPGPGGYGVVLLYGKSRQELSGGFKLTTNNRMELMAAIEGLKFLKEPSKVKLYSDSRYVVNGISLGWAKKWRGNNWWRTKKEKALNPDLWEHLLQQCDKHKVEFVWIKGHAGNRENERCDELSNQQARKPNLPEDKGYKPKDKSRVVNKNQRRLL